MMMMMTSTCTQQTAHHEKLVLSITNVFENYHHAHKCILFPILEEKEPQVTQTTQRVTSRGVLRSLAQPQQCRTRLKHGIPTIKLIGGQAMLTVTTGTVDADTPASRF
jgi:hypothetical protein